MDELVPVLFVAAIFLVVVAGIAWSIYAENKRTEKMRAAADDLGLPFFPTGDPALQSKLAAFQLFTQGRGRTLKNMVHGEMEEVAVGIFDYQYTTGSGKHSKTWRQTVVHFDSPHLELPQFAMRPENLFHKLGSLLGMTDINFESHPVFSGAYLLQGGDEERVRALFRDELLDHFENHAGVCVEGHRNQLVYYRTSVRIAPEQLRSYMEEGYRIFSLMRSG